MKWRIHAAPTLFGECESHFDPHIKHVRSPWAHSLNILVRFPSLMWALFGIFLLWLVAVTFVIYVTRFYRHYKHLWHLWRSIDTLQSFSCAFSFSQWEPVCFGWLFYWIWQYFYLLQIKNVSVIHSRLQHEKPSFQQLLHYQSHLELLICLLLLTSVSLHWRLDYTWRSNNALLISNRRSSRVWRDSWLEVW